MRRRQHRILYILLAFALFVLATMHPDGSRHLAQISTELLLALVDGVLAGAAAHPGAAAILAGLAWITINARTHRPRPARAHH